MTGCVASFIVRFMATGRCKSTLWACSNPSADTARSGRHLAQGLALVEGMAFVAPDHVRALAVPVLAHRLALDPQAKFSGATAAGVIADILRAAPAPA